MNKLYEYLLNFFPESGFPAVRTQIKRWSKTKPLNGLKVLDATPVFRNTMLKYTALLAAGAEVTAAHHPNIPADPEVIRILPEFGIALHREGQGYDVIADCAGCCRDIPSRYGYAELTRTGLVYYQDCRQPVVSVDSGILKRFETTLGTGESYLRAMRHLGYSGFAGKKILIFGGGKVGQGIAWYAAKENMQVFIADQAQITVPENITLLTEKDRIKQAIHDCAFIVSATGVKNALTDWTVDFRDCRAVIANMGVEDEFGSALPAERVLNRKMPLNFILPEPTLLRYIDPVFALSNAALLQLVKGEVPAGITLPPRDLEFAILEELRGSEIRDGEISFILQNAD